MLADLPKVTKLSSRGGPTPPVLAPTGKGLARDPTNPLATPQAGRHLPLICAVSMASTSPFSWATSASWSPVNLLTGTKTRNTPTASAFAALFCCCDATSRRLRNRQAVFPTLGN